MAPASGALMLEFQRWCKNDPNAARTSPVRGFRWRLYGAHFADYAV